MRRSTLPVRVTCAPSIAPRDETPPVAVRTEWVLLTSGTTGVPKMVVHDLAGLTAAITSRSAADAAAIWGTFYDIRRYGGLQIFLRAMLGGASLVLSSAGEPVADHLARLGATWRHAPFRHAVALAPRADEPGDRENRAALCPALRRDRRSGHPRRAARGVSAGGHRPRLCFDRSRRRLRRQRRSRRLSRRVCRNHPRWRRDENRRRLVAHPLAAGGVALRRQRTSARPTPTALSTPATSSSAAATATISPAARAASSISAA